MSNTVVVDALDQLLGHTILEINLYATEDHWSLGELAGYLVASYPTPVNELTSVAKTADHGDVTVVVFVREDGHRVVLHHHQDCCESVWLEDVDGEWSDLIGTPLIEAEEVTHDRDDGEDGHESSTWTFYKLATTKGCVTLRFIGTSNGYYSEDVSVSVYPPQKN